MDADNIILILFKSPFAIHKKNFQHKYGTAIVATVLYLYCLGDSRYGLNSGPFGLELRYQACHCNSIYDVIAST